MFGWEFSPIVAGGLGVVAKAISSTLADSYGAHVTYVLPRIPGNFNKKFKNISIVDAEIDGTEITKIDIDSNLISPYADAKSLGFYKKRLLKEINAEMDSEENEMKERKDTDTIYNYNLLQEVESYAKQAEKISKSRKFDVIHNHDWMTGKAAMRVKKATDKPMVMHVHATEIERTLHNPHPEIFEHEKESMEFSDKIIAVSELTKQKIVANYGIESKKIEVVHNAVEFTESKYGPIAKSIYDDDKIVLFLARMTAMKGADYLLRAAVDVIKEIDNVKFLFVGDGELLKN
jgi:glycosyltransferase involved in cell wall biosynthesis